MEDEGGENDFLPEAELGKVDDDADMVAVEENIFTPKVEEDKVDPSLAEWLKIDEKEPSAPVLVNDDSATDADSDNEDVAEPGEDAVDLDDWFQVKGPDEAVSESHQRVRMLRLRYAMAYVPQ